MILIVSDTHCYYDIVNQQIEYAENVLGHSISCVIHLGDFGIYKAQLSDYFKKKKKRFLKPLYCIDGNHEDFKSLHKLVNKYKDCFTYLPRASVHTIEGYRFLALGGAAYMDAMITERGSVITHQQINECLAVPKEAVDIIITHDCPVGIGVPSSRGLEHFGETGFPGSEELVAHFKPKMWLFGHHHKWFHTKDSHTAYYGVSGIWKGFGLLDDNYNLSMVSNKVAWKKTTFLERFLIALKIIHPDNPEHR
ncbi:MAG: metallophosphoesterase [Desulfobacteraceae bacterium]|jgi:predicted phosphodiesterase